MSEQRIDPPIPLPEFDPYEQLGKARQRIEELSELSRELAEESADHERHIAELEAEVKKLQGNLVIAQAYMSKAAVKRFRTQREKK